MSSTWMPPGGLALELSHVSTCPGYRMANREHTPWMHLPSNSAPVSLQQYALIDASAKQRSELRGKEDEATLTSLAQAANDPNHHFHHKWQDLNMVCNT